MAILLWCTALVHGSGARLWCTALAHGLVGLASRPVSGGSDEKAIVNAQRLSTVIVVFER